MKTPVELLFHEPPDYTFLKVFGCACWPHLRPYNSRKLEFRSKKCVFLGYSSMHKGYKCLHVPSNRVYISRDVVFDETVFPFASFSTANTHTPSMNSSPTLPGQFEDVAYSHVLLPNYGAGIGRGARLELLASLVLQTLVTLVVAWGMQQRRSPRRLLGSRLGRLTRHGYSRLGHRLLAMLGSLPRRRPTTLMGCRLLHRRLGRHLWRRPPAHCLERGLGRLRQRRWLLHHRDLLRH